MRMTTAICLILFCSVASSHAGFGLFASWQDTDEVDSGYGIGMKQEVMLSRQASVDFRLSYLTGFTIDRRWSSDEDLTVTMVEAIFDWNVPMPGWTPYFGGGFGYYIIDPDWIDSELGFVLHGGAKLDTGRGVAIFGELKYTTIEPDQNDLGGVGVNAGVIWRAW